MDFFPEEYNVKQHDHFDWMKTSLIELASSNKYWDMECICCDGKLKTNRFYVGMIFPQITDQSVALLPDYSVKEITGLFKTIFNNLSHMEGYNDLRYTDLSEPVPQDPLALNPVDVRKIMPHTDPIDPGSHMMMHFLEEPTNLYTAQPQPQPQLQPQPPPRPQMAPVMASHNIVLSRPTPPTMAPQQVLSYVRPNVGQPITVRPSFPGTIQPVTLSQNFAPPKKIIYIDQNGKRLQGPILLKSIQGPGMPFNTVTAQTVRFPGNGTTNPRMPTFPKQPINIKSGFSIKAKPTSSSDEVLVAKAPEDPLAFLTTKSHSSSSLLTASSLKKLNKNSLNNDREGIYDGRGILIGYKNNDSGPRIGPKKRPAEVDLVLDDFSDDDTIETLESGVLYLVNSQRARVMKPKIKCRKVKISAEQLQRIREQEQEEEEEMNTIRNNSAFDDVVTLS